MKSLLLNGILMAALALGPAAARADTDAQITAHRSILDLAGAFTNDGFKLRDGSFSGTLAPGKSVLVQVNLYAGNEYWFAVSTADAKSAVSVNLYDETGNLLKTETYSTQADTSGKQAATDDPDAAATNRAAAGFAPDVSGPYYVRLANTTSTPATYCLVYSYK